MRISDIIENQTNWKSNLQAFGRGFGQRLRQRIAPGIDWRSGSAPRQPKPVTAAKPTAQPNRAPTTAAMSTQAPTGITPTSTTSVTVPTAAVQPTAVTAPTAPAQAPATKPRVMSQPIRVGNKVYRPGDPMHARLSQMMQAQQQT